MHGPCSPPHGDTTLYGGIKHPCQHYLMLIPEIPLWVQQRIASMMNHLFLTSFKHVFPLSSLMQTQSFQLTPSHIQSELLVISILHGQKFPMPWWTQMPKQHNRGTGVPALALTSSWLEPPSPVNTCPPHFCYRSLRWSVWLRQINCGPSRHHSLAPYHPKLCFGQLPGNPQSRQDGQGPGLTFTRFLYHSYREEDPGPKLKLALPISVFENILHHEGASINPKDQAMVDLMVLAFFFLFHVGEYAPPEGKEPLHPHHTDLLERYRILEATAIPTQPMTIAPGLAGGPPASCFCNYNTRQSKEWTVRCPNEL
jgi:hypothetical protein